MSNLKEKKVTVRGYYGRYEGGMAKKFPVLTAYGCQIAALLDRAGSPDASLSATLSAWSRPATPRPFRLPLDEIIYHTRAVRKGS